MAAKKKSSNKSLEDADYALFQAFVSSYANSPSAMTRTQTAANRVANNMRAGSAKDAAKKKSAAASKKK